MMKFKAHVVVEDDTLPRCLLPGRENFCWGARNESDGAFLLQYQFFLGNCIRLS